MTNFSFTEGGISTDIEIARLQRRVADLEAAVARLSRKTDRTDLRRRATLISAICTGIFMLCVGILVGGSRALGAGDAVLVCAGKGGQLRLPAKPSCEPGEQAIYLGGGAGPSGTAQGGASKVVEPFVVVDKAGRELFKVTTASGNGVATVYGPGGNAQVVLGSPPGSKKPQIQVLSSNGSLKAGLGLRESEGDGVVQLWGGKTQAGTVMYGQGKLYMFNAQLKTLVNLGITDPDWSHLALSDQDGKEQVTVGGSAPGSGRPTIQVLAPDGSLRTGIGINPEGNGAIAVKGAKGKTSLWVTGNGLLQVVNAQDKKVVSLGASDFGAGVLRLFNPSGTDVVGIFSTSNNFGMMQLYDAAGQERVTLGTLTNGKGDVCASGNQGKNCLSRIDPRY